ncbi:cadherin repeat domain-containing protein [Catenovulum sp. 2E275]|uniref:cadherin repeat domain-containing protein n=1 Tax=Catenovulum sp. 2E275 TaxID=2980497 RepID=UPI0021D2B06A|nr:cadherin repeat domain-containing protein [Catenovulum sp. 2E275]MCU4674654.1 cadherin repeat domain-containing protein [Catenovulum sp. 2E275]
MTHITFKTSLIAAAILLAGCSSDDNNSNSEQTIQPVSAVAIHTVASDYTSGQQVLILDSDTYQITNTKIALTDIKTDYTIKTYQDDLYHIGRYTIDTIEKFTAEDMENSAYSFSTQQAGEEASGNPYDIVFVNEEKAFVIRYGSDKVLIINPSATDESDFITGSIDISAYNAGTATNPTAADGLINDGKLYIVMQRMENWVPQTAYVAVFDVQTGEEIETNANSEDNLKGIPLNGINPQQDSLTAYADNLYITSNAAYSTTDISTSKIEKISLDNYALTEVLNASDIENNTANVLSETIIVNDEQGYFYASSGWPAVSNLYQFNPSTGLITQADVAATVMNAEGIADIALDTENRLWVSVSSDAAPGVDVYSVEDNSLLENRITTELPPVRVEFFY